MSPPASRIRVGPGLRPGRPGRSVFAAIAAGLGKLRTAGWLLMAALLEIFDESSYRRFLAKHRLNASRASYSAFLREQETAKMCRLRCC